MTDNIIIYSIINEMIDNIEETNKNIYLSPRI